MTNENRSVYSRKPKECPADVEVCNVYPCLLGRLALLEKITELEERLTILEARPYIVGVPGMSGIEFPIMQPMCTCGTMTVCLLHEAALEVMRVAVPENLERMSIKKIEPCMWCCGDGKCADCSGSGECLNCRGAGGACMACNGSGRCSICNGSGACPDCVDAAQ